MQKRAAATPGLVAADATAVLTAGTANITGFHYVGNVNVPTAGGTHMHMTQEVPEFTEEQRQATIAGWQTFFDVLQEIAEAARGR